MVQRGAADAPRDAGMLSTETDQALRDALLGFLQRHHDQHFGAAAKQALHKAAAEREREWGDDPEQGDGGSFRFK